MTSIFCSCNYVDNNCSTKFLFELVFEFFIPGDHYLMFFCCVLIETSVDVAVGIVVGFLLLVVAVVGTLLSVVFVRKKYLEHHSRQQA